MPPLAGAMAALGLATVSARLEILLGGGLLAVLATAYGVIRGGVRLLGVHRVVSWAAVGVTCVVAALTVLTVLHHGGPGTPGAGPSFSAWGALTRAGLDVYGYDQVGAGRSERLDDPTEYTVHRQVADLEAVRRQLGAHSWSWSGARGERRSRAPIWPSIRSGSQGWSSSPPGRSGHPRG